MMYDVIVIGTGPAGLTAGQYTSRRGLETLLLEKESIGGELINRHEIETYPGFPDGITGTELRSKLVAELEKHETAVELGEVEAIRPGEPHVVRTAATKYRGKTVILATGGRHSHLDVPGADQYEGRGVFHCAQCDGPLYRDEKIAVVGGSDHALTDALFLTKFASAVTVVTREARLSAGEYFRDEVGADPDVDVLRNTEVTAIDGDDGVVDVLELTDTESDGERTLSVGGLYVCIGLDPNTAFLDSVPLTDDGHVVVGSDLMTEVEGIFAVGDVRQDAGREIAASVGDGAVAARAATKYIE